MSLRSPLGKVLGTGSAHAGPHHWWAQRLTSIALLPLSVWLVASLLALPGLSYESVRAWMGQSWSALLLILLVLLAAWHSRLGVQVVLEDYVPDSGSRTVWLVLSTFAHALLAAAGVLAILKVYFASGAIPGAMP
jgi:succinate dehydrogenase / fumarate reductase membrane anchor subunit